VSTTNIPHEGKKSLLLGPKSPETFWQAWARAQPDLKSTARLTTLLWRDSCLNVWVLLWSGLALASAGPDWKHFYGAPLSDVCINIWWGHRVIIIEIGDVKERGLVGLSGGMASSFTSPTENSTDISVTPNKSKSCYIQYLLSGHGTFRGVRQPSGNVLNEISQHHLIWSASKDITA